MKQIFGDVGELVNDFSRAVESTVLLHDLVRQSTSGLVRLSSITIKRSNGLQGVHFGVNGMVEYPKQPNLAFGVVPLCVPASRKIKLNGIPTCDLPFEIEIVQPHPYFRVDPCVGVLPANETVTITVTYNPITFGSNAMVLRLSIKLMGFTPKDCVVSARAVSGLIEQQELKKSIKRVAEHKNKLADDINNSLSESGTLFYGKRDMLSNNDTWKTLSAKLEQAHQGDSGLAVEVTSPLSSSKVPTINLPITESDMEFEPDFKMKSRIKNEQLNRHDPVSTLLASTFHNTNTGAVLDKAIAKLDESTSKRRLSKKDKEEMTSMRLSANGDGKTKENLVNDRPCRLLSSKVLLPNGKLILQGQIKVKPRGPGAGAVFDAGSEWMSHQFKQKHERRMKIKSMENIEQNEY